MNDKPRFRDFYRAYRLSKMEDDLLYVYEKKRGKLVLYKKPEYNKRRKWNRFTMIPATILPISLLIYSFFAFRFWGSFFDAIPASYFLQRLIIIISDRLLLSSKKFEKVSEIDWDANKEKVYKGIKGPYRVPSYILAFVYLFGIIFMGFTPVYVRYLADRALGIPWEAEVRINTSDDYKEYIELNEETKPDEVFVIKSFDESKEVYISLNTFRIPERMSIYINREDTGFTYEDRFGGTVGHFWSDRYFNIFQNGHIVFRPVEGQNTLELKSDNFYKKWTFTLEYE